METVETYKEGERVVTIVKKNGRYSFSARPGLCAYCMGLWYDDIDGAKRGVKLLLENRNKLIMSSPRVKQWHKVK
jgi:hypothetical protein